MVAIETVVSFPLPSLEVVKSTKRRKEKQPVKQIQFLTSIFDDDQVSKEIGTSGHCQLSKVQKTSGLSIHK